MFSTKKTILFISSREIIVSEVRLGTRPKIVRQAKIAWHAQNLSMALNQILKSFPAKTVRVLLADELAYVARFTLTGTLTNQELRQAVRQQVAKLIPESFNDLAWDYRVIKQVKNQREILVFAPVVEPFSLIAAALRQAKLVIEAIEPQEIARTRHAEPIIGLALKRDLKGQDQRVLNVPLPTAISPVSGSWTSWYQYRWTGRIRWLVLTLAVMVSVFLGGLFYLAWVMIRALIWPSPQPLLLPETAIIEAKVILTPTPTPLPEPDWSSYKVQVLNGSGVTGEAKHVADLLTAVGFSSVKIGNTSGHNTNATIVRLSAIDPELTKLIVAKIALVLSAYQVEAGLPLTDTAGFDLLITVGKKAE